MRLFFLRYSDFLGTKPGPLPGRSHSPFVVNLSLRNTLR